MIATNEVQSIIDQLPRHTEHNPVNEMPDCQAYSWAKHIVAYLVTHGYGISHYPQDR